MTRRFIVFALGENHGKAASYASRR
jgi:hypothetical protein